MGYSEEVRQQRERAKAWREEMAVRNPRLCATVDRIAAQVASNERKEQEMAIALEWCRANGNPHLRGE